MTAPGAPDFHAAATRLNLQARFGAVRAQTLALVAPLSAEDCCVQSMPDASPAKWHLAHTSWFFETFILERFEPDFRPWRSEFRVLFNSYYNGVGKKHPRPQRGLLTRPGLDEVLDYRRQVDTRLHHLLATAPEAALAAIAPLVELGAQHEQQHQELLLTDIKHLFSCNPLLPAYATAPVPVATESVLEWRQEEGGVVMIGHAGADFCFDNEAPRHRQYLHAHALASRLVSNAEYAAFIAAGGYGDPALWLAEGWDWICREDIAQPLYWQACPGGWSSFTLHGLRPLDPAAAVVHLSYYEADAYARWAGARLPTEAEWENAASSHPEDFRQLLDTAWQWTASSYAPYPGFRAAAGAIGEYNGKFMVNQYVLRGGSAATPAGHARASYRNFFPAGARWQLSGIRLARDC